MARSSRLNDPRKMPSSVVLSTKQSIVEEAGWQLGPDSLSLPTYEGVGSAIVDDEGNSFISYHRRPNGLMDNYVVSFNRDGGRRWGLELPVSGGAEPCIPWTAFSDARLAVRCAARYSGQLVLLGTK